MIDNGFLTAELTNAGLPIYGCAILTLGAKTTGYSNSTFYTRAEGVVRVEWLPANFPPTGPQDTSAAAVVAAHNGTAAALNALRAQAAAVFADLNGDASYIAKAARALALVTLDELNLHALKMKAILDACDGAATFAAFKTAVAAITDYPQRTIAQLKTAMQTKINAGDADS